MDDQLMCVKSRNNVKFNCHKIQLTPHLWKRGWHKKVKLHDQTTGMLRCWEKSQSMMIIAEMLFK